MAVDTPPETERDMLLGEPETTEPLSRADRGLMFTGLILLTFALCWRLAGGDWPW